MFLKCRSSGTCATGLKLSTGERRQIKFFVSYGETIFVLYYKTVFYLQEILYFVCYIILKYFLKLIIIIFSEINTSDSTKILACIKKNHDKIILIFESGWKQTFTRKIRKAKQKLQVYTRQQKKNPFGLQFIFETLHLVDFTNVQQILSFLFLQFPFAKECPFRFIL